MNVQDSRGWGGTQDFNFETILLYGDKRRSSTSNNFVVERKTYASEKIITRCTYKRVYVCVNCPQCDSNISLFLLGRLAWFVC